MNSKKPVELPEKIDYLNEKITRLHWEVKRSEDFELRLNFEELIDNSINSLLSIKNKSEGRGVSSPKKSPGVGKTYSAEKQQLEMEKKMMHYQMQDLQDKQKQVQYEALEVKILSQEKEIEKLRKESLNERRGLVKQIEDYKGRIKFLEQEIQNITQLNQAQQDQMEKLRSERNRSELKYLELRDKYQEELGMVEKYGQKSPKYLYRSSEGLKCIKTYTNYSSGDGKGTGKKLITLKLPLTLEVNKIVYGVMLGVPVNSREVMYYDKFQLFEKEVVQIGTWGEHIAVEYKKRKPSRVVLDKYKVRGEDVIIMLFGKGDSIMVHE